MAALGGMLAVRDVSEACTQGARLPARPGNVGPVAAGTCTRDDARSSCDGASYLAARAEVVWTEG